MRKRNGESGFTLIEILVVVAILGLLAAVALPQYNAYKRDAVDTKTRSGIRDAVNAVEAYYDDNSFSYAGLTSFDENLTAEKLRDYGFRLSAGLRVWIIAAPEEYWVLGFGEGGNGWWLFSSAEQRLRRLG